MVLSAHGVAPEVYAHAARPSGLEVIRNATCPLVTKVHVEARRASPVDRVHTILLMVGHAGHEEVVEDPPARRRSGRSWSGARSTRRGPLEVTDPRNTLLPHSDHALGGRDEPDRTDPRRNAIPSIQRPPPRRHLLRHAEPPGRRQGDRPAGGRSAGHRVDRTRRTRTGWRSSHASSGHPAYLVDDQSTVEARPGWPGRRASG